MEEKLKGLCQWLKDTKGITKIEMLEMLDYFPEYEEYLEEQKKVWVASVIKCDFCGHVWNAVHHIESERLECPRCHNMTRYDLDN
jgi:hypothetical protein